ncbi:MAG TPA: tetratricopeptide repeat protein [Candidatus Omnitrophota bacterium]|nr:tetratricopeptide repeat protein [Candidatus Omnitrophota bacterium]
MADARELYAKALEEYRRDRLKEAIALLEDCLRLDPGLGDAREALGLLYFQEKRTDDAIACMRELAGLDPGNIMAHANLSRFYAAKGLLEEAEREQAESRRLSWKAELRMKTSEPESSGDSGQAETVLRQKIETYRKVIELDPKDVLGYFSLGTAYLEGKRHEEAREVFEKAAGVNPDHSPSYLGWGQALEALGRRAEALEVYRRGIPVAERSGDMIPLKKMQARAEKL